MKRWIWNVLIAVDQLGNAASGGDPDETISSRLGKTKRANGGSVHPRAWLGVARPLDWLLEKIDPGHALGAIEEDEGEFCPMCNSKGRRHG